MPKQKSSATSSTRKKHARKAAGPISDPPPTKGKPGLGKDGKKTKKGDKKGEPRVKAYIPPVKPQPIAPDPLDSLGLAYALPAELVVAGDGHHFYNLTAIGGTSDQRQAFFDSFKRIDK